MRSPVCGTIEDDPSLIYIPSSFAALPDPPTTDVVNYAIDLFASLFPLQDAKVQDSILLQLSSNIASGALKKDPARQAAIHANSSLALLQVMESISKSTAFSVS